jgi:hypothetical protein
MQPDVLRRLGLALLTLGLLACASPPVAAQPTGLPNWWSAHVAFMSRDGGVWITPNPAGEDDPNAPDAYGMEWRAVAEGHGLVGRLYGVEAGREIAEYWTFREFWHPGERRVLAQQWGATGAYGVGETTSTGPDRGEIDQTFWLADGRSWRWREGHRTREDDDVYVTEVYDISADGVWTLRNSNTWARVREGN